MGAVTTLTLVFLLSTLALLEAQSFLPRRPITSCKQLPYPDACRYLPSSHFGNYGFRHQQLLGAIQRVNQVYAAALAFPTSTFDPLTLAAWSDCMELFQDINFHLQESIASPANDESQVWLSSTVGDLETCRNGFTEFNQTTGLSSFPFFSSEFNVSQILSNSLAVNRAGYSTPPAGRPNRRLMMVRDGFPEWVSSEDRRLLLPVAPPKADLVVAKDGSGKYKTIGEALAAAARARGRNTSTRYVIYVKAGVYKENVEVTFSMRNIMIFGDGIDRTIVTGSRNVVDGSTTYHSATFATIGQFFIARDMTFENTAGPHKLQAVAVRSGADFSVFYRCSFKGYQDTLLTHLLRQFYRECDIYGTVDFIFGDAAVVLQNCSIYCRRPLIGQHNIITAQGRSDPNENTGISIHNSRVAAAPDLRPVQSSVKSYLGRPWRQYSRTVFMKTYMDSLIAPEGWVEWSGDFALNTLYYAEYANAGPGARTSHRVKWKGYRIIGAAAASNFTVGRFISGNSWLPNAGVPFTLGL